MPGWSSIASATFNLGEEAMSDVERQSVNAGRRLVAGACSAVRSSVPKKSSDFVDAGV